jgi:hypothetical protein
MAVATAAYTLHYPAGYDDRVEAEMTEKGYLPGAVVELADGSRYELTFYDPVRLAQNAERLAALGIPFVVLANSVVVPEMTPAAIRTALEHLVRHGHVGHLRPIAADVRP